MMSAAVEKRHIQMSADVENGGSRLRGNKTGEMTSNHRNLYQPKGDKALNYNPELIRWLNKRKPKKSTHHTSSLNSSGVKKENRNGPLKVSCCNDPSPFLSL